MNDEFYIKKYEDEFTLHYNQSKLIDFISTNNIYGKYILHVIYKINKTQNKAPHSNISTNIIVINNEIIKYSDDYYLIGNKNEEIAPDIDKIVINFNKITAEKVGFSVPFEYYPLISGYSKN